MKKLDFEEIFKCRVDPADTIEVTPDLALTSWSQTVRLVTRHDNEHGNDRVISVYLDRGQVEDIMVVLQYWLDQTEEE